MTKSQNLLNGRTSFIQRETFELAEDFMAPDDDSFRDSLDVFRIRKDTRTQPLMSFSYKTVCKVKNFQLLGCSDKFGQPARPRFPLQFRGRRHKQ